MTMDSRQKAMLGGLGVLIVGMGGFWYAMAGGHSDVTRVASGGPNRKVERVKPADKAKPRVKHRAERKPKATGSRHERKIADTRRPGPKKRRGDRGPQEKKKNVPPAS